VAGRESGWFHEERIGYLPSRTLLRIRDGLVHIGNNAQSDDPRLSFFGPFGLRRAPLPTPRGQALSAIAGDVMDLERE
jgi:hypothetical protein